MTHPHSLIAGAVNHGPFLKVFSTAAAVAADAATYSPAQSVAGGAANPVMAFQADTKLTLYLANHAPTTWTPIGVDRAAFDAVDTQVTAHLADHANPHQISLEQVPMQKANLASPTVTKPAGGTAVLTNAFGFWLSDGLLILTGHVDMRVGSGNSRDYSCTIALPPGKTLALAFSGTATEFWSSSGYDCSSQCLGLSGENKFTVSAHFATGAATKVNRAKVAFMALANVH